MAAAASAVGGWTSEELSDGSGFEAVAVAGVPFGVGSAVAMSEVVRRKKEGRSR